MKFDRRKIKSAGTFQEKIFDVDSKDRGELTSAEKRQEARREDKRGDTVLHNRDLLSHVEENVSEGMAVSKTIVPRYRLLGSSVLEASGTFGRDFSEKKFAR